MRITVKAAFVLIIVVIVGLSALAGPGDIGERVGDVVLTYEWGDHDQPGITPVRIGNEERTTAYGGVKQFTLGTQGAVIERSHETVFVPIHEVTRLELMGYVTQGLYPVLESLRQRAEWQYALPEVGSWHRLNFTYTIGNRSTTVAASEAMLTDDYLVVVASHQASVELIRRSLVDSIEWPHGELVVTPKVDDRAAAVPQVIGGEGKGHSVTLEGIRVTVLSVGTKVQAISTVPGSPKVPPGHPAGPVAEPTLVVTLLAESVEARSLMGMVWGQGWIGERGGRVTQVYAMPDASGGMRLEITLHGVEFLAQAETAILNYQLTPKGASGPTTYAFEINVPVELRQAQFPPKPAVQTTLADMFTPEAVVLERFIQDVRDKNETHLRAWTQYSGQDGVLELLMDSAFGTITVAHAPVSGGNQLAAILLVFDENVMRFREFAVFFRYGQQGWRLVGFFEAVRGN